MKALILNSGMGSRMGTLTSEHPKCMTPVCDKDTILSRQLRLLCEAGLQDVVITTGYHDKVLREYCASLKFPVQYTFVCNPEYENTNYIYSIYCARDFLEDDILLLHGDLVFDAEVLKMVLEYDKSCMVVSSGQPIVEKDFKAVIHEGRIQKIGVEFLEDVMMAQPMYQLKRCDWEVWLKSIVSFCKQGDRQCYAENAFNKVSEHCRIYPFDVEHRLCFEIDTPQDLEKIRSLV